MRPGTAEPRLLDRVRREIRVRNYSLRTEAAYVDWIKRFIVHNDRRHPNDLGPAEVAAFLTHLAVDRGVAPSTQAQAKSALLFLYRVVLGVRLPWLDEIVAAKNPRRLPVVLTPSEVRALLAEMSGSVGPLTSLLYGTGMRLLEGLRLRVKDVEFTRREIVVRDGKGGKDRVTVLPENLIPALQQQLARARALHQRDLAEGFGTVWLPHALELKYADASRQGLPSPALGLAPTSGALHPVSRHRWFRKAAGGKLRRRGARLVRRASPHVPCDARPPGPPWNSLRSLRSLRSKPRAEYEDEARLRRAARSPALLGASLHACASAPAALRAGACASAPPTHHPLGGSSRHDLLCDCARIGISAAPAGRARASRRWRPGQASARRPPRARAARSAPGGRRRRPSRRRRPTSP
jgi:site-specific recombinase XerD